MPTKLIGMEGKRVKLLWLVNVKLPVIDKAQNKCTAVHVGGWLTGLYESLNLSHASAKSLNF